MQLGESDEAALPQAGRRAASTPPPFRPQPPGYLTEAASSPTHQPAGKALQTKADPRCGGGRGRSPGKEAWLPRPARLGRKRPRTDPRPPHPLGGRFIQQLIFMERERPTSMSSYSHYLKTRRKAAPRLGFGRLTRSARMTAYRDSSGLTEEEAHSPTATRWRERKPPLHSHHPAP